MLLTSPVLNLAIDELQLSAIMAQLPRTQGGHVEYKHALVPALRKLVQATLPQGKQRHNSEQLDG